MIISSLFLLAALAAEWTQFRGPNAHGVAGDAKSLPVEFAPDKNVLWRTPVPVGHSSPVLAGNRIFLTGSEGLKLFTLAVDRRDGKVLWTRELPGQRTEPQRKANSMASPTTVTDGETVFAYFGDFGLIAYSLDGKERWRKPMGPFNNMNGVGTSPVLAGDLLILNADQDTNGYILAVDKRTGKDRWKADRSDVTRSYATPVIYRPPNGGPAEVLIAGAYRFSSFSLATGESLWWVNGLSWQTKPTPIIGDGLIYVASWESGGDTTTPPATPTFEEALAQWDANKDGRVGKEEITDERLVRSFAEYDLDLDLAYNQRDWSFYRSRRASQNALFAIRPGGRGDVTATHVAWKMSRNIPNSPSPLLHEGVLYMVKDGGIFTSLDAKTGEILKQGRLEGAIGTYYSSPVLADGKIYVGSEPGKVTVLKPGAQWEVLATNDMGEEIYATPAFAGDRMYLRTRAAIYCIGQSVRP